MDNPSYTILDKVRILFLPISKGVLETAGVRLPFNCALWL